MKGKVAGGVGLVALALASGPAEAATTTFHIQNTRAVPQVASLYLGVDQLGPRTDAFGNLTIAVDPGDTFYFSRNQRDGHCAADEQASPEGSPGLAYIAPAAPPANVTITLPSIPYTPSSPALDDQERELLRLANSERRRQGAPPLTQSLTLDEAADSYATALYRRFQANPTAYLTHCAPGYYGPQVRILDRGWPDYGVENIAIGSDAREAFTRWMNSPGHRTHMLRPTNVSTGVAHVGTSWVHVLAGPCPRGTEARCRMTGFQGAGAAPPSSPAQGVVRSPGLRLRSIKRRGRVVRLRLTTTPGATGKLKLEVRKCTRRAGKLRCRKRRARVRQSRRGSTYRLRVRLGRGRWQLRPVFDGTSGWADQRLRARTVRIR